MVIQIYERWECSLVRRKHRLHITVDVGNLKNLKPWDLMAMDKLLVRCIADRYKIKFINEPQ